VPRIRQQRQRPSQERAGDLGGQDRRGDPQHYCQRTPLPRRRHAVSMTAAHPPATC
jgi:hypothetical protein